MLTCVSQKARSDGRVPPTRAARGGGLGLRSESRREIETRPDAFCGWFTVVHLPSTACRYGMVASYSSPCLGANRFRRRGSAPKTALSRWTVLLGPINARDGQRQ
jgi:hypothetical protein